VWQGYQEQPLEINRKYLIYMNYFIASRARFTLLILACTIYATGAAAESLPLVSDLEAAAKIAREQRAPLLVAFTLKRCPYCNTARREYWAPLNGSAQWRGKVVMVELMVDGAPDLRDFEGKPITARDFARRHAVRSVPTVIVFDGDGIPAARPLVGLVSADFYGAYLEQAIEAGLAKTRAAENAVDVK
jgi:thioredoxin-related protein